MAGIIKFSNGSHWYARNGTPQHDADLRVARKSGLYPSVTSVDKDVFPNLFLERWKLEQLVKACVDNPRMMHETVEWYANRVHDISNTKARVAAEFGKEIHDAVETYPEPCDPKLSPWVTNFADWYNTFVSRPIHAEKVLLDHDIGVAGRTDFIGDGIGSVGRIVCDWKTQDVKVDDKGRKKPNFYDSWQRQLSLYAVADAKETGMFPVVPTCVSVIIDSNPEAGIYAKVWTNDEMVDAYEEFVAGTWLWCRKRGYWANGSQWAINSIPLPARISL